MKKSVKLLVAVLLVMFGTVTSYAKALSPSADERVEAAVYVAPDGDDETGDGSLENPFRTVATAVRFADPQTTIYVREGQYDGDEVIFAAYNPRAQTIPIRPYPGEQVEFKH